MIKTASREELFKLLEELSGEYRIAAPVLTSKGRKERVDFACIDSPEEIFLKKRPDSSPKGFFLPQNERMTEPVRDGRKTILLGLRSCDLQAVRVLDDVYLGGDYVDAHYLERRRKTVIVGYSCSSPEPSCFCQALGIDPVENGSAPLYLFQDGERFFIRLEEAAGPEERADDAAASREGPDGAAEGLTEGLVELAGGLAETLAGIRTALEGLDEADEEELQALIEERKGELSRQDYQLNLPIPLPEAELFAAPFWEEIAEKCLGCGSCTFYCPTCYCFGFIWQGEDKIRGWDSCMFAYFTRHASGHNPRTSQTERYRQRLLHKYSYHPRNYGGLACTGCGRCLDNCPVNLDIRAALKTVENYLEEEGVVEDG